MHGGETGCPHHVPCERLGLLLVVLQYEASDLIGHFCEERVPLRQTELAVHNRLVQQDLDVDLVIRAVHSCGVVDGVGVDTATCTGELDPSTLSEPEVAALPYDAAPQLVRVDADRIVHSVAGLRVGLDACLDEGSDCTVPKQVDRRPEYRRDDLIRRQGVRLDAENLPRLAGQRNRLRGPGKDVTPRGEHVTIEVVPARV